MAISQSFIDKQARRFGDRLLLKKRWGIRYILLLNMLRQFGDI
jgi:hypothetical protein